MRHRRHSDGKQIREELARDVIDAPALNLTVPAATNREVLRAARDENTAMKVALLAILGLMLGALGGAGGALLFGVIAFRDAEIAGHREPACGADR